MVRLLAIGSIGFYAAALPLIAIGARRPAMALVGVAVLLDVWVMNAELESIRIRTREAELAQYKRELEEDGLL